ADMRRRKKKQRPSLPVPTVRAPALPVERLVPAGAAVVFAAWTATAMPFYPAGWWAALAVLAGALTFFAPRAGLALALAVPILPLGNYASGLAFVYAALAVLWLAVSWREPRSGLFFGLGPLLGPISCLGFLPAAGLVVRDPIRRAVQVA